MEIRSCPDCSSSNGIRKIFYGLPDGPVDEEKYAIGGCSVSDDGPTIKCSQLGWEGQNVNNAPDLGAEIQMFELLDISKMHDSQIDSYAKHIWEKLANSKVGEIDDNSKR